MRDTFAFQIVYLYKNFLSFVNQELKNRDVSRGQIPFIIYVGKHEGCAPCQLTKELKMDWGHSQRSITRLVEQNLMIKQSDSENKRNYHLYLTESGKDIFKLCHQMFNDWDALCFSKTSKETKVQMIAQLNALIKELED